MSAISRSPCVAISIPVADVHGTGVPVFRLLSAASDIDGPGDLVWEGPHQKAQGAHVRRFRIEPGHLLLTVWSGRLHEVIYQTPVGYDDGARLQHAFLFEHYGEGVAWNELFDNGFGKSYLRADGQAHASWSNVDFHAFWTEAFHAVKW